MNFLELSPSLGIHDLFKLIFNLPLLTGYTLNSIASVFLVFQLIIIITQHKKFQKFHLNRHQESLYVITVQSVYNLFSIIDYYLQDMKLA